MPSQQLASIPEAMSSYVDDECPNYDAAVSRSNTTGSANSRWHSPFNDPPAPLKSAFTLAIAQIQADLLAAVLPGTRSLSDTCTLIISLLDQLLFKQSFLEPKNGKPDPGLYNFRLFIKVNHIERPLCEPVTLKLSMDPRRLDFVVFVFPGKQSLPAGSLWSLRVWLRVNGISHRVFGEDEVFVGKDLDFNSIADASFARLKTANQNSQVYHSYVGRAPVVFTISWKLLNDGLYQYSFEYESGGVGGTLIEDFRLRLECDPRAVSFTIYSLPITSMPPGASHRIRVWLRSLAPFPTDPGQNGSFSLPFVDSYIYQRIWKFDSFKIGAYLDFASLGNRMVLGFASGSPETVVSRGSSSVSTSTTGTTSEPYGGKQFEL